MKRAVLVGAALLFPLIVLSLSYLGFGAIAGDSLSPADQGLLWKYFRIWFGALTVAMCGIAIWVATQRGGEDGGR